MILCKSTLSTAKLQKKGGSQSSNIDEMFLELKGKENLIVHPKNLYKLTRIQITTRTSYSFSVQAFLLDIALITWTNRSHLPYRYSLFNVATFKALDKFTKTLHLFLYFHKWK